MAFWNRRPERLAEPAAKVLERWFAAPVYTLAALEGLVGPLQLGDEHQMFLQRDAGLPPGIASLSASLAFNHHRMHSTDLSSVMMTFDGDPAEIAQLAAVAHGAGRRVREPNRADEWIESGTWFYVATSLPFVRWSQIRPDWAYPLPAPFAREEMLGMLVDRLICESDSESILAALQPLTSTCCIELSPAYCSDLEAGTRAEGFSIHFRPAIDSALVIAAFRWPRPVAFRHDRGGHYTMGPDDAGLPQLRPRLGVWEIDVTLDHVPALPQRSQWLYDAAAVPTTTAMIMFMPELA